MIRKSRGMDGASAAASRQGGVGRRPDFCSASTPATKSESRTTSIERLTVPMEEHDEHHASLVSDPEVPFPP